MQVHKISTNEILFHFILRETFKNLDVTKALHIASLTNTFLQSGTDIFIKVISEIHGLMVPFEELINSRKILTVKLINFSKIK